MAKIKRLIWDIETSPNIAFTWRTGWKINIDHDNLLQERAIICICYKWEGESKVFSLEWDKGCDKKMIRKFLEVARPADALVAHNGDKFDLKWFNTRILFHELAPPPIWKTVDTLAIARRRFLFNSNRLDYLGKYLFGAGKLHTEFGMWKDIVSKNCPKAMARMVKYCKMDVKLLEKVWKRLEPFHTPKTHVGVLGGNDKWTCPYTGSTNVCKNKTRVTSAGTVRHEMISKDTKHHYSISQKAFEDYLLAKEEKRKAARG